MIAIRQEENRDIPSIRQVEEIALGEQNEANLVDALRSSEALLISLVAEVEDKIVGHVAFSEVSIESESDHWTALGLGPMAVLPAHQGKGIGSKLVEAGLRACEKLGYPLVVVLGHSEYYPRFGFSPARPYGISWEGKVPDEVFMVKELGLDALSRISGTVRYRPEFNEV